MPGNISAGTNSMSDRYFINTNIVVYTFDKSNPDKRDRARELIQDAISLGAGLVSFQVVQEFLNVATGKFKSRLSMSDAREYLAEVLLPLCEVFPGGEFYAGALDVKERTNLSFYDSMILHAAREGQCRVLSSEDLQDGFKFYDVTVKNPFR
jgi:predicted nucleic acid-binding protein